MGMFSSAAGGGKEPTGSTGGYVDWREITSRRASSTVTATSVVQSIILGGFNTPTDKRTGATKS